MDPYELADVSTALLDEAAAQSAHRAARTLTGGSGHALRQTAIALLEGSSLSDHENPGEATLQVLVGGCGSRGPTSRSTSARRVRRRPPERHGLLALTDAVVLLTAAMT